MVRQPITNTALALLNSKGNKPLPKQSKKTMKAAAQNANAARKVVPVVKVELVLAKTAPVAVKVVAAKVAHANKADVARVVRAKAVLASKVAAAKAVAVNAAAVKNRKLNWNN